MNNRIISPEKIESFKSSLLREEKSPATIEKYIRDVEKFRSFAGERPADKALSIEYKQSLLCSYAAVSVNSMLTALNCFFKYMRWYDCTVKTVRIQKQSFRPDDAALSREEYYRLLKAAEQAGNTRLYLIMQTICATGIRIGELRFITLEAVLQGRATVSLKGKTRQVLLPGELCSLLRKYCRDNDVLSGSIFITRGGKPLDRSNIFHGMKALCEQAGVDSRKVYPHNLRHLFACAYYDAQQDISRLADILGHSSINTTRIYVCTSGAEQQLQIERLGLVRQAV